MYFVQPAFYCAVVLTACVRYMYQCVVIVVAVASRWPAPGQAAAAGANAVSSATPRYAWHFLRLVHSDVEVVVHGLRRGVVARLGANLKLRSF